MDFVLVSAKKGDFVSLFPILFPLLDTLVKILVHVVTTQIYTLNKALIQKGKHAVKTS